ncbi:MAG: sigma-54-dependent Fis family transcriptional regulator [Calditrichaeota bacterium]|nr:MAG: sigma-54-dependent Fis family transcriptional regulator [Calditrichota bacterium]
MEVREYSKKCYQFGMMIGKSRAMRRVFHQLATVSRTTTTVLIKGPVGSGKKTAAREIHLHSPRKHNPLFQINCTSLSHQNIEQSLNQQLELYYPEKVSTKISTLKPQIEATLLLLNVDELTLNAQAGLLRITENPMLHNVGQSRKVNIHLRIIATTSKDLRSLVEERKFREDLFYSLNIFPVELPPLSARKEDIPILFVYFLRQFYGKNLPDVNPEVFNRLKEYVWPGNVRELRNLAERLALACKNKLISMDCLPEEIRAIHKSYRQETQTGLDSPTLEESVAQLEIHLIRQALMKAEGNKARAAKLLKLPPSTLKSKMKKYGL